jgi:hypothetical protein
MGVWGEEKLGWSGDSTKNDKLNPRRTRRRLGGDNDVDWVRHFYLAVACGIIIDLLGNNSRTQLLSSHITFTQAPIHYPRNLKNCSFDDPSRLCKGTVSHERMAFNISTSIIQANFTNVRRLPFTSKIL